MRYFVLLDDYCDFGPAIIGEAKTKEAAFQLMLDDIKKTSEIDIPDLQFGDHFEKGNLEIWEDGALDSDYFKWCVCAWKGECK